MPLPETFEYMEGVEINDIIKKVIVEILRNL